MLTNNQSLLILGDQVFVSGIRFLITFIIARELGPEVYGTFVLFWSIALLFSAIQSAVIINPLLSMPCEEHNHKALIQCLFFINVMLSVTAFIVVPIVSYFMVDSVGESWMFIFLGCYASLTIFYEFIRRFYFSEFQIYKVILSDALVYIFSFSSIIFLYFNGLSLQDFLFAMAASLFIGVAANYQVVKAVCKVSYVDLKKNIPQLWAYTKDLLSSAVAQFISGHLFIYVSVYFLGTSSAGEISAAKNIFGPMLVLFISFDNLYSSTFRSLSNNKNDLNTYMKEKIILWAALLATICVVISYYAQEIISIVYGNDYQFAAELIKWFALAHLLMAVVKMLHIYCRTMSANKFIKFGGWFSLILTCIFIIPMVYIYGYTGAMIIMVGQQLVLLYCLNRGYIFVNNSNGAGKAQGIIKG